MQVDRPGIGCQPLPADLLTGVKNLKLSLNKMGLTLEDNYDDIGRLFAATARDHACSNSGGVASEHRKEVALTVVKSVCVLALVLKYALRVTKRYVHGASNDARLGLIVRADEAVGNISDGFLISVIGLFMATKFDTTKAALRWSASKLGYADKFDASWQQGFGTPSKRPSWQAPWLPPMDLSFLDCFVISIGAWVLISSAVPQLISGIEQATNLCECDSPEDETTTEKKS